MEFIETPLQRENRALRAIVFVLFILMAMAWGYVLAICLTGGF